MQKRLQRTAEEFWQRFYVSPLIGSPCLWAGAIPRSSGERAGLWVWVRCHAGNILESARRGVEHSARSTPSGRRGTEQQVDLMLGRDRLRSSARSEQGAPQRRSELAWDRVLTEFSRRGRRLRGCVLLAVPNFILLHYCTMYATLVAPEKSAARSCSKVGGPLSQPFTLHTIRA